MRDERENREATSPKLDGRQAGTGRDTVVAVEGPRRAARALSTSHALPLYPEQRPSAGSAVYFLQMRRLSHREGVSGSGEEHGLHFYQWKIQPLATAAACPTAIPPSPCFQNLNLAMPCVPRRRR